MQTYRPDRLVRFLTATVSLFYYALWLGAALLLIGGPVVKLSAGGNPDWTWGLRVWTTVQDSGATVLTAWGPAHLRVENVRADIQLPIAMLPWWFVSVLWAHLALASGLMLLASHNLRRIFHRVREGAPFDAHNAVRLRSLGLLLLALAVMEGVAEFITAAVVRSGLTTGTIRVSTGLHFNAPVILVGLVMVALAEIFRRGAELEIEQSLVV
jgi:hypothetical protein